MIRYQHERRDRVVDYSQFEITRDGKHVASLLISASIPFDGELAQLIASAFDLHERTVTVEAAS